MARGVRTGRRPIIMVAHLVKLYMVNFSTKFKSVTLFNCVMCSDVCKDKSYTWDLIKVRGSA